MKARFLLICASALLVGTTWSGEKMDLLHREITDIQRAIDRLSETQLGRAEIKQDLDAFSATMSEQQDRVLRSNADLGARFDAMQAQIESLRASLEMTTRQLDRISQELTRLNNDPRQRAGIPPVQLDPDGSLPEPTENGDSNGELGGGQSPVAMGETPQQLFERAYKDYMTSSYELAAMGFGEYLERFPSSDQADNALYWVAECHAASGRHAEALDTFSALLERYPSSDKAAAAQLKKALTYLEMDDQSQAVINLQYVVYEHPATKEADLARDKLKEFGFDIR